MAFNASERVALKDVGSGRQGLDPDRSDACEPNEEKRKGRREEKGKGEDEA
jgi:hypothetical protein